MKAALSKEDLSFEINLVLVKDDEQAASLEFLGSPSFRINGMDLWPEQREHYALGCRVYTTPEGLKGVPTIDALRQKIRAYIQQSE